MGKPAQTAMVEVQCIDRSACAEEVVEELLEPIERPRIGGRFAGLVDQEVGQARCLEPVDGGLHLAQAAHGARRREVRASHRRHVPARGSVTS